MNKVFGISILLVLFFTQIHAQDKASQATAGNVTGARITFINNDTVYDFGGVPAGSVIDYQYEIKNTGTAPLVISGMTSISENIKCKWPAKPIKAGKKGFITVTYTAKGNEGSFAYGIYITSNATPEPYPFLNVTGAIIPAGGTYVPSGSPSLKSRGGKHGR